MKILDPRMLSEWPYRPDGRGPAGRARDHCRVAAIDVSGQGILGRGTHCTNQLTCIQQIQGLVEDVRLVDFGVATVDNEGIANEQTGVADSGPRTLSGGC